MSRLLGGSHRCGRDCYHREVLVPLVDKLCPSPRGLQLCGAISWGVQGDTIDMDRSVAVHCLWHAFHMQTLCGELTSRCISSFCSPPVLGSNVVAKRMCMSTLESGIYPRKERLEVRSHVI